MGKVITRRKNFDGYLSLAVADIDTNAPRIANSAGEVSKHVFTQNN
jgi:hypothetical protein